jgi:nicotinamide mononucleotide (NMN) deamidase PncC
MKSKTLALIFIASMVAGFFMAAAGDNSGNSGLFWTGIVVLAVCVVSFVKWYKQQDQA